MATKSETKLDWKTLDLTSVDDQIAEAFGAAKEAYKVYQAAKQVAEELVIDSVNLPATHTLRFGYRFGGISFAIDVADAKKPKKGSVSLADFAKEHGVKQEAPRLIKKAG